MIDVQETLDKFQDFLLENRKKTVIICCTLILLMLIVVVIMMASEGNASRKNKKADAQKLVLDQPLMSPAGPVVPEGYITTRKTEKNWSEEEIEKWFTLPSQEEVEQLGQANDRIIQDIIGAAP